MSNRVRCTDGPTSTHFFSGGGGDTEGLRRAGFLPCLAINHDAASIATHAANFPDCEHLNSNIEQVEMRRLRRTDVLWASPLCTEISPAGGRLRRRRHGGQLAMFADDDEPLTDSAFERTRVTALSIISATEVHRYDVVMGENVVEFGTDWELFDWWVQGMRILGYSFQLISVNAAHVSTATVAPAPQWRDRLFFVFTRKGITMPVLEPRPLALCPACDQVVHAYQWWKKAKTHIGKYRQQYLYRCPNHSCRNAVVEPFVRPAASILDFSHIGERIGDRKRPLAANTLRRVQAGLDRYPGRQSMVTLNHGGHEGRSYLPSEQPLATRSTKIGDGLLSPPGSTGWAGELAAEPFIAELRRHGSARPVTEPLSTVTSGGNHHALVVPYYSNGRASLAAEPLSTVTTVDRHALVTGDRPVLLEDCHLRMVQPREQFRAQGFPDDYQLRGTKTQQTAQAGNAVPVNVAQWIGEAVHAALDSRSAM